MENFEIERKWIIRNNPDIPFGIESTKTVLRGYLNIDPEIRITEIYTIKESPDDKKINSTDGDTKKISKWKLAVKSDGSIERKEIDLNISADKFITLSSMMKGKFLTKYSTVYKIPDTTMIVSKIICPDGYTLTYAEVEFSSIAKAKEFILPLNENDVEEVTDKEEYKMKNIWKAHCAD